MKDRPTIKQIIHTADGIALSLETEDDPREAWKVVAEERERTILRLGRWLFVISWISILEAIYIYLRLR